MAELGMDPTNTVFNETAQDIAITVSESITFLSVLSISAIITTVSLFFCGIPICVEIYRRKSTYEISGFPFVMGFLGGSFWLRYGFLKMDTTMITVNLVGVTMMLLYSFFYIMYTKDKTAIIMQVTTAASLVGGMLFVVQLYGHNVADLLGFMCMSFNIVNFGAPLAGLRVVLHKKCCDSLPLPLITANLLVSSQWCLYGVLIDDIYIIIPNSAGVFLALIQLSLFLIFPRKVGASPPLSCLFSSERTRKQTDTEKGAKKSAVRVPALPAEDVTQTGHCPENRKRKPLPFDASLSNGHNVFAMRSGVFDASLANSFSASTCTRMTSLSTSYITGVPPIEQCNPSDIPAARITITSSDNEIEDNDDDVDAETPLNSPSAIELPNKTFQFDDIPEADGFDSSWLENELRRAQSAPQVNIDE